MLDDSRLSLPAMYPQRKNSEWTISPIKSRLLCNFESWKFSRERSGWRGMPKKQNLSSVWPRKILIFRQSKHGVHFCGIPRILPTENVRVTFVPRSCGPRGSIGRINVLNSPKARPVARALQGAMAQAVNYLRAHSRLRFNAACDIDRHPGRLHIAVSPIDQLKQRSLLEV